MREEENSDLELTIAGTKDYISMVEAGAQEITEEDMLAAMTFGQEAIAAFCEKQAEFLAKVNPQPKEWPIHVADPSIAERVDKHFDEMSAALKDADKLARMAKVEEVKNSVKENDFTEDERAAWGSDIAAALKSLEKHAMRKMVMKPASVQTVVPATIFALCTLRLVTCLAFTVLVFSSVAKPRLSLSQRLVCSMNGNVSIPLILQRASAICISTISRLTALARLVAWVRLSVVKLAMVPWLSALFCPFSPTKRNSLTLFA